MEPDEIQKAWQLQPAKIVLTDGIDLLLKEVQRNDIYFKSMIFWRDVREVAVALTLIPIWVYMGITIKLPWTWYLTIPALIWVAGFMLVDRKRHARKHPGPDESLRLHVQDSLEDVEHQIWLLKNIFWWYLLPFVISISIFFLHVALQMMSGGWAVVLFIGLFMACEFAIVGVIFLGVYQLNQTAVQKLLEPRRKELLDIQSRLSDETSETSGSAP